MVIKSLLVAEITLTSISTDILEPTPNNFSFLPYPLIISFEEIKACPPISSKK